MGEKDFAVLIHEFGHKNYGTNTTRGDLYEYLKDNGVNIDIQTVKDAVEQIIAESYAYAGGVSDLQRLIFKVDAYYRHLDYIELQEARTNTKAANRNATIALLVASGLALLQVIEGYIQIKRN